MTIKELADFIKYERRTVELWAKKASEKNTQVCEKISQARKTRIAANFTLTECLEIVRVSGNETLAELLDSASRASTISQLPKTKLPNGVQMQAITNLYCKGAIDKNQVAIALGLPLQVTAPTKEPSLVPVVRNQEPLLNPEAVEAGLRGVLAGIEQKAVSVASAVVHKELAKEQGRALAEKIHPRLPFESSSN